MKIKERNVCVAVTTTALKVPFYAMWENVGEFFGTNMLSLLLDSKWWGPFKLFHILIPLQLHPGDKGRSYGHGTKKF